MSANAPPTVSSGTWQEIFRKDGSGNHNSAPFLLSGAQARLLYKVDGTEGAPLFVSIYHEGESVSEDNLVNASAPEEGETRIVVPPGSYFLKVISGVKWSLVVQEMR